MLCKGISGILIVDLTFDGQCHLLPVRRKLPCSDGFAFPGSHPSPANRMCVSSMRSSKVPNIGFSNLCWLFDPFESRSLHQERLCKNCDIGTASSYELRLPKMVVNRECGVQKSEAAKL